MVDALLVGSFAWHCKYCLSFMLLMEDVYSGHFRAGLYATCSDTYHMYIPNYGIIWYGISEMGISPLLQKIVSKHLNREKFSEFKINDRDSLGYVWFRSSSESELFILNFQKKILIQILVFSFPNGLICNSISICLFDSRPWHIPQIKYQLPPMLVHKISSSSWQNLREFFTK